jgi:hypothetical protein
LKSFDPQFVETRREALDAWLKSIVSQETLHQNNDLRTFLNFEHNKVEFEMFIIFISSLFFSQKIPKTKKPIPNIFEQNNTYKVNQVLMNFFI